MCFTLCNIPNSGLLALFRRAEKAYLHHLEKAARAQKQKALLKAPPKETPKTSPKPSPKKSHIFKGIISPKPKENVEIAVSEGTNGSHSQMRGLEDDQPTTKASGGKAVIKVKLSLTKESDTLDMLSALPPKEDKTTYFAQTEKNVNRAPKMMKQKKYDDEMDLSILQEEPTTVLLDEIKEEPDEEMSLPTGDF